MKFMILGRAVFNRPILHRPLRGGDCRRIVGIEQGRCRTVHRDEEIGRARRIARVRDDLREVKLARRRGCRGRQSREPRGDRCTRGGFRCRQRRSVHGFLQNGHRSRRVVVAGRTRIDIQRPQTGVMDRGRRTRHDELGTPGGWNQHVGLSYETARPGPVLGSNGHSVETHDRERLGVIVIDHLQVENRVGGGVDHAPELALSRLDLDDAGNETRLRRSDVRDRHVVQRHIPGGYDSTWVGIAGYILISEDQYTLRQSRDRRLHVRYATDDDCAGGAALDRGFRKTVQMRVIPVHSRWFVGWKMHAVLEALTGIDDRMNDLIRMARRRGVGTVVVNVQRSDGHRRIAADVGWIGHHFGRRPRRRRRYEIRDGHIERVARQHVQGGRLEPVWSLKAEESPAGGIHRREVIELDVQCAGGAEQPGRRRHYAAGRRPRTRACMGSGGQRRQRQEKNGEGSECHSTH